MKQRFLIWGLASITFVVTLAFSSWHEGLWLQDAAPTHSNRAATLASSAEPMPMPAQPFGPEHPGPAAAEIPIVVAATPPQPQALQQSEPQPPEDTRPPLPTAEREVDTARFLEHRDRAAQHSARSR